jgi:hypothetical protein
MLLLIAALAIAGAASPARSASLEPGHDVARQAMIESGVPQPAPTALDSVPHPWPGIALSLSVVGTAAPVVVALEANRHERNPGVVLSMFAVEILSPSAGHLYAGLNRRAVKSMIARGIGFGILAAGGASNDTWSGTEHSDITTGDFAILLGATVMGISAAVDVITVASDVEHRNAEWLRTHAATGLRFNQDGQPEMTVSLRF